MKIASFTLKASKEMITSNAGLAVFGEFCERIGLSRLIRQHLPTPGSNRGYKADAFVSPLIMMMHAGGCHLEDLRLLTNDPALRRLTGLTKIPEACTMGDWLRRTGQNTGLDGLGKVNRRIVEYSLRSVVKKNLTLDIDATGIEAEKFSAFYTYKGFKGYMPMVGHIAENGIMIGEELREGNVSPSAKNLEFIKYCVQQLPHGKKFGFLRADAASYQKDILDYCEENDMSYAIGGSMCASLKEEIEYLPESSWETLVDRRGVKTSQKIATLPWAMTNRKNVFRMIILRTQIKKPDLFNPAEYSYRLIATNILGEEPQAVVHWYCERGEYSENQIKELKQGFSMDQIPCGTLAANAVFFRIGALAYNLYILFKKLVLESNFSRAQMKTIRLYIYHLPGKVVHTARKLYLKLPEYILDCIKKIRDRIKELSFVT